MLRWHFIKENGILRSNMKKSFEAEERYQWNSGYLFFTSDINDALVYGLNKSLVDMMYLILIR